MPILDILNQLNSNRSRNFKLQLLTEHQDNELLKKVIKLALDPFVVFYIKKVPAYHSLPHAPWKLAYAITLLDELTSRAVTGHEAINHLKYILQNVTDDDAEVIKRIISKDLKCGVSTATVNAIWPELIPDFPMLLSESFDQKLLTKMFDESPTLICQTKCDGARFNAIVEDNKTILVARSGKLIEIDNETLYEAFNQLCAAYEQPMVFDGELLVLDTNGQDLNRQTGNGLINKAIRGTLTANEAASIRAVVWDAVPLANFKAERYEVPYQSRSNTLVFNINTTFSQCPELTGLIQPVYTTQVSSEEEAMNIFNDHLDNGYEGVILKSPSLIWENKRSKKSLKLKSENDIEMQVVGWVEGTGKNVGLMGALECVSGDISCRVGTGFTDQQRKDFTSDYMMDKIITVCYNQIITDKRTGKKSLYLPRFKLERLDKETI